MELVLGLAALATALSSVGAVNHIKDGPETIEAEPTTAKKIRKNESNPRFGDDLPSFGGGLSDFGGGFIHQGDLRELGEENPREVGENDDFLHAIEIGVNNYTFANYSGTQTPDDYSKSMRGAIGQEYDVDFYKFTIYGKAVVTVELKDIPYECDYDIELYAHSNTISGTPNADEYVDSSCASYNDDEIIQKLLYPNTYYIKISSYDGYGSTRYTVSVNVEYQREDDVLISDLKAKGAKGALWLSDYDPYGIKPTISASRMQFSESELTDSSIGFQLKPSCRYRHGEFYIFEESLRQEMLNVLNAVFNGLKYKTKEGDKGKLILDIIDIGLDIGTTILSFCGPIGEGISLAYWSYGFSAKIAQFMYSNSILPAMIDAFSFTRDDYLIYLNGLIGALTAYNPNSDTGKSIIIPMTYTLEKIPENNENPLNGTPSIVWRTYYSCQPSKYNLNPSQFIREGDSISAQNPNNPITGTVYPIVDVDSTSLALDRKTYDMHNQTLSVGDSKTLSLEKGQYQWYEFTAPTSGNYYFKSVGDAEATADVFEDRVCGKSDYNRVSRYYKNNGISTGVNFSLSLEEDQTIYLRVSGGNGSYSALSSTTLKISNTRFRAAYTTFTGWDLDVPMNLDNPFFFNHISSGNSFNLYVSSVGAFYNTNRNAIELLCDRDNNKPFAFLIMLFDRPIKQMNFGTCIGNSYSYAHLGLYLQGLNQYGFPVTEDVVDSYCDDHLLARSVRYDNRDEAIYGVMFRIDPETDTSPYHVSYQEQLLGNFLIEFND